MYKYERTNLKMVLATAVLSLAGLAVLPAPMGAEGAAIATALAIIILNLSQAAACVRIFWINGRVVQ